MPPYDDWNNAEEEDDQELQDISYLETKKDVILFCIDCSPSMQELREDPEYEDVQTSHLLSALNAALEIQKRKIIVGPNDSVGILFFNTMKRGDGKRGQGAEIKRNTFLYQPIAPLNASVIQDLIQLIGESREDPQKLGSTFPPLEGKRVPMGDVFTSCNWVIRDGAPKTATKRIFLISDEDSPHGPINSTQLLVSARTTLIDLIQSGVTVEPFFISTDRKSFDVGNFYTSVLANLPTDQDKEDASLNESISISRIDDLLSQMRFHEVPKRAVFSVPLELGNGFVLGVKGYGLVTEQKKGAYKYFADLGDRMEVVDSHTTYTDEVLDNPLAKTKIVYGISIGIGDDDGDGAPGVRIVEAGNKPFYSAEDIKKFRTLGLEPGLKLLGFKPRETLRFEDNVKHSMFIYPDEMAYSGSRRAFLALLRSMLAKDLLGLVLGITRSNATPTFWAMLPQRESDDDPSGFHLIPLPFADDIRSANVTEAMQSPDEMKELASAWVEKLKIGKKDTGVYQPDSYPNPALAYHNAQLEASAFHEEYDPGGFEDLTLPRWDMIHKRAGSLMKAWKLALLEDESANMVTVASSGATKRKADVSVADSEIQSRYDSGSLNKLRVDQLKEFLKSKSQPVSGKKAELVERVGDWLDRH